MKNKLKQISMWWRDMLSINECKHILRSELDRDYDENDSLRCLIVVAVNALYRERNKS
jgi:hypothetical protein